jgi:hypothetical protein
MATSEYLLGRKKYGRPQAMLWANNPGTTTESGLYVPLGYEVNSDNSEAVSQSELNQFLILTDDNRLPIDISFERIEQRQRMINGRMRSHHIADKREIATSWENVPSRAFSTNPLFDGLGKPTSLITSIDHDNNPATPDKKVQDMGSGYYKDQRYTSDGGAGGVEMLQWYSEHPGSFWLYLAYDNYKNFDSNQYGKLGQYNEVIEVYFGDFQYAVARRGSSNHDFWDISVRLEEV